MPRSGEVGHSDKNSSPGASAYSKRGAKGRVSLQWARIPSSRRRTIQDIWAGKQYPHLALHQDMVERQVHLVVAPVCIEHGITDAPHLTVGVSPVWWEGPTDWFQLAVSGHLS